MDEDPDLRDFSGVCRLFPLPGVVLFPHAVLPLHIFEPRYRQMTEDALADDRLVAIVQVCSQADWAGSQEPAIEPVACLGKIVKCERSPDGRFNFLLQGLKRVRIVRELKTNTLYRQAEVEILEDIDAPWTDEISDLIPTFKDVAKRVSAELSPDFDALLDGDPPVGIVTDLVAQSLGLPAAMKQVLLADQRVDRRASGLLAVLRQVAADLDAKARRAKTFPPPFSDN